MNTTPPRLPGIPWANSRPKPAAAARTRQASPGRCPRPPVSGCPGTTPHPTSPRQRARPPRPKPRVQDQQIRHLPMRFRRRLLLMQDVQQGRSLAAPKAGQAMSRAGSAPSWKGRCALMGSFSKASVSRGSSGTDASNEFFAYLQGSYLRRICRSHHVVLLRQHNGGVSPSSSACCSSPPAQV